MRPARVIQATWLLMLAVQTIGSVDVKHKLPAPRQYVAISTLWGILFVMADTGLGRIASRLSLLVLLTASVVGPFGAKFISWLTMIAQRFGIQPPSTTTTTSAPGQSGLVSV